MSHSHSKNARHVEQSTTGKDIRLGTIILVGFISLAVFAGGIGWSYGLMSSRQEGLNAKGAAATPSKLGQAEIGIVDQVLFETDHRLEVWKAENTKRLDGYGWVDRAKGVAHMPIELAMQQVVASPPDIAGEGVPPVSKIPAAVKAGTAVTPAGNIKPATGGVSMPAKPVPAPAAPANAATPGRGGNP